MRENMRLIIVNHEEVAHLIEEERQKELIIQRKLHQV